MILTAEQRTSLMRKSRLMFRVNRQRGFSPASIVEWTWFRTMLAFSTFFEDHESSCDTASFLECLDLLIEAAREYDLPVELLVEAYDHFVDYEEISPSDLQLFTAGKLPNLTKECCDDQNPGPRSP